MQSEFSHIVKLDKIGSKETFYTLKASPEERAALAKRLKIVGIDSFEANVSLRKETGSQVLAKGDFKAVVIQTSVISLQDFSSEIEESFSTLFSKERPAGRTQAVDIDMSSEDEEIIADDQIDIGELATEYLALALPPFPRAPDEAFVFSRKEQDIESKEKNPFDVLKALK